MASNKHTCKNCESKFNSTFKFCPNCGQKTNDKLTIGVLFYNTISNYFSFDARFFKSFIPLLIKPGFIAKEFVKGKRLLYLHPAQMYLFIAVVFFFLNSFNVNKQAQDIDEGLADAFKTEQIDTTAMTDEELRAIAIKDSLAKEEAKKVLETKAIFTGMTEEQIDSIVNNKSFNTKKNDISFAGTKIDSLLKNKAPDSLILKEMGLKDDDSFFTRRLYTQALKFLKSKQGSGILRTFYDTLPISMFIILPLFALILKLFFRKSGPYSHHLVFSFYLFAFVFLVMSILLVINYIKDIPDILDFLIILSTFIYFVLALRKFYNQSILKCIIKSFMVSILFLPFLIIVGVGVLFFSVLFY